MQGKGNKSSAKDEESQRIRSKGDKIKQDVPPTEKGEREVTEEEEGSMIQRLLKKLKGYFKQKPVEMSFDDKKVSDDILKLLKEQRENMMRMKKFVGKMEKHNLYIYEQTWKFTDRLNTECEKYFYKKEQKEELKKFRKKSDQRFKAEMELSSQQYSQLKLERSKNLNTFDNQNISSGQKSQDFAQGLQQAAILSESNAISVRNRSKGSRQLNFNSIPFPMSQSERDEEDPSSTRRVKKEFGESVHIQMSLCPEQNNKENLNDDEEGKSGSEEENEEVKEEDEEDDSDFEDEEDGENQNNEKGQRDSEDEDSENTDKMDEDDNEYEEEYNVNQQGQGDGEGEGMEEGEEDIDYAIEEIEQKERSEQEEDSADNQLKEQEKLKQELQRRSQVRSNKLNTAKSIRYSKALTLNEPLYFQIIKDKVERVREEDFFKKSIVSFRIVDKNIDSYLPELLNRLAKNFYSTRVFGRILFSCQTDLNIEGEYDPKKIEMIKHLSPEVKKKSFMERTNLLLKFYIDEADEAKQQLSMFKKNLQEEKSRKQYASQYRSIWQEDKFKTQQARRIEIEDQFKKYFARYTFHREEDLFHLVMHLFNKQLLFHSDCLEEINKFDRWILVNQGNLEKMKEKKVGKKGQAKGIQVDTPQIDQMKVILEEVDYYLEIIRNQQLQSINQQPTHSSPSKQESPKTKKNKFKSDKKN